MRKIRVTQGGCGISYTDANGNARYALKTAESGPFDCDDAQAERLIRLGVAQAVGETAEKTGAKPMGILSKRQLNTMGIDQLKQMAADMGIDGSDCKKKGDWVNAITAQSVQLGDEEEMPGSPDAAEMIV